MAKSIHKLKLLKFLNDYLEMPFLRKSFHNVPHLGLHYLSFKREKNTVMHMNIARQWLSKEPEVTLSAIDRRPFQGSGVVSTPTNC
jgi:hypothetical protein